MTTQRGTSHVFPITSYGGKNVSSVKDQSMNAAEITEPSIAYLNDFISSTDGT